MWTWDKEYFKKLEKPLGGLLLKTVLLLVQERVESACLPAAKPEEMLVG